MPVERLRQVAQHVDDLDRAVAFYRDVLGLTLIARFDPPGLAFFELGETRLLLEAGAPSALLYLGVDDVAAATEAVRAKGAVIEYSETASFAAVASAGEPPPPSYPRIFRYASPAATLVSASCKRCSDCSRLCRARNRACSSQAVNVARSASRSAYTASRVFPGVIPLSVRPESRSKSARDLWNRA